MKLDVMGLSEAAAALGVHRVTVDRWIKAGRLTPDAVLRCGPIFRSSTVERFRDERRAG